ncbi:MAG: hypothetical protein ACRD2Q_05775 [Terriglobales bacterium]
MIIDGKKVGEISNGETKEFPIPAGQHQICLKIDWCGSNTVEFTVAESEKPTFHARSNLRGRPWLTLWYVFFARDSYLLIEQDSGSSSRSRA